MGSDILASSDFDSQKPGDDSLGPLSNYINQASLVRPGGLTPETLNPNRTDLDTLTRRP